MAANDSAFFHGLSATDLGLTLEDAIGLNLPHGMETQCGNWRDWIIGMTVILADGTVAKMGSKVVKNVAGYDAHKLFVGARGTLGLILSATLRTMPVEAVPAAAVVRKWPQPEGLKASLEFRDKPVWIQRTLPSDFDGALQAAGANVMNTIQLQARCGPAWNPGQTCPDFRTIGLFDATPETRTCLLPIRPRSL